MKKIVFLLMIIGMVVVSCKKNNDNKGIIDPPEVIAGDPEITSVAPLEAGPLSTITIEGKNFSANKESNVVTINGIIARILSATSTKIQAEVPANGSTGDIVVKVLDRSVTGPLFTFLDLKVTVYITETYAGTYTDPLTKGYIEGDRRTAQFNFPEGLVVDSKGNLIIADRDNHVIRKITPAGQTSLVAGTPGVSGSADGAAFSASFYAPLKVDVDAQDNIYVADRSNNKIRRIDAVTGMVSTVAGTGDKAFADGAGAAAKFNTPVDVAVATDGTIYVADSGNERIRKIAPNGTVSTLVGNGTRGFADGTGTEAMVADPYGVAIDNDGNVVVADRRNHRVRKITPAGVASTIAGTGKAGFTGGPALEGQFSNLFGVDVGKDGTIYIADYGNYAVRMISPDGILSTIGGDEGRVSGHLDGNPSKYKDPTDVAVDADGNVYVADYGNHLIRRIVPTEQ